jgi:Divergent InlB B-repeat domain
VQYVWKNWSDGGAISHTVAPTTNTTYTATFKTQYYLNMTRGIGGTVSPANGWKDSGAAVSISATPANGYSFSNWTGSGTGSYSGTNNPASITMGGPITEAGTFIHN